jgi:Icc-related predicted phosphoesterase
MISPAPLRRYNHVLLLTTDLHTQYHLLNLQIEHAETSLGKPIEAVVVLGDFGLFSANLSSFFRNENQRFSRPVYCIEGNHEEFGELTQLIEAYSDCFSYIPRGEIRSIGRFRFLGLGGAAYMDAVSTPMHSEITPADIAACLRHAPSEVDIIISHDCPEGIGMENAPGFEHYGKPGFPGGEALFKHFQPALWVFGHHHRWFECVQGSTQFYGLAEIWKGYALLDADGKLSVVKHELAQPPSFWQKIWNWFFPGP